MGVQLKIMCMQLMFSPPSLRGEVINGGFGLVLDGSEVYKYRSLSKSCTPLNKN